MFVKFFFFKKYPRICELMWVLNSRKFLRKSYIIRIVNVDVSKLMLTVFITMEWMKIGKELCNVSGNHVFYGSSYMWKCSC